MSRIGQGIKKSVLTANSVLYAVTARVPAALSMAASRILGRKSSGNVVALTAAEILTIINVVSGADVTGNNAPQAHKNLHDPNDGSDPLDTAAPVQVGSSNAIGTSHSLPRADHVHQREHAKYLDSAARSAAVSDAVYGAGWNGVTTIAPSKNAVYDKIETLGAGDVGEGHILILAFNYNTIGQGTWSITAGLSHWGNASFRNSSGNNGDNLTFKVFLSAGTYTLRVLYYKNVSSGICDIDIDGDEKTSFDTYADPVTLNQIHTQTGITVATSGLKTITVRADGKNGSSAGYILYLTTLALWRTA